MAWEGRHGLGELFHDACEYYNVERSIWTLEQSSGYFPLEEDGIESSTTALDDCSMGLVDRWSFRLLAMLVELGRFSTKPLSLCSRGAEGMANGVADSNEGQSTSKPCACLGA